MTPGTWESGGPGVTSTDVTGESDPDVISRQIDHTRDAMAGTLDEIQRRLEPEQVSSYVKDVAYYVALELKSVARDLAGEAMTNVRAAAPKPSIGTSSQERRATPRFTESTRAFLDRYTGSQAGAKAGKMSNQTQGLWKKLEANPLALGAVGIALAALSGSSLRACSKRTNSWARPGTRSWRICSPPPDKRSRVFARRQLRPAAP